MSFLRLLIGRLFRLRPLGLEHLPGRLVAANRHSRWDWLILAPFLKPESRIVLPRAELPATTVAFLFRGLHFLAEDDLDDAHLAFLVQQGHTVLFFPEPPGPASGFFRKIDFLPGLSLPWSVLALEGTERWQRLPRWNMTVVPLANADDPPPTARELQDGLGRALLAAREKRMTLWHSLITAARRQGRKTVILEDADGQRLDYQTLIFKAILLSRLLESRTAPGEHVGLMLPTTVGAVVTFFAFQAGGRIPAMLNFTAGSQPLRASCRTAHIRRVVTAHRFVRKARLQDLISDLDDLDFIYLEDLKPSVTLQLLLGSWWSSRFPRPAPIKEKTHEMAVILFTSGSEGDPKGVALSHDNLLANITQFLSRLDFGPKDVILNMLPMFHAFGLTVTTLAPLFRGMRVFCHPALLDYRAVARMAWKSGATVLAATDTFLRGYGRVADPVDFSSVRYCFAGAEPLQEPTRTLWMEKFGIRILEGYGATETAPVLSFNVPEACRTGSVGRLLPGVEWRLEPIPGIDAGGRLVVSGPNVMMGYFKPEDPGRVHPSRTEDGFTGYDTGDVVRIDADGFVWVLGRVKRFAKIGGEMVSLAAVEAVAMARWPEATHAVVALADPRKGETLVLVTTEHTLDRLDFVQALKDRGASLLMLPSRLVHCDTMPLLANGKVDFPRLHRLIQEETPL
ncbi:MAG: AMP-binding protein [Magnetococcales bacterium]|nr:AMP-binding protein [Magnetococcales bacterium]